MQKLQKKKPQNIAKKAKPKAKNMANKKREVKQKRKQSTKPKSKKVNTSKIKKPLPKVAKNSKSSYLSKENLVSEVGARWWYVLPDWPPADHKYEQDLLKHNLRVVEEARFKIEPDVDEKGLKKVHEVE